MIICRSHPLANLLSWDTVSMALPLSVCLRKKESTFAAEPESRAEVGSSTMVSGLPIRVNLRELGLNSINFIKLVVYLEGTFEIEFEEEFLEMDVFENIKHIRL